MEASPPFDVLPPQGEGTPVVASLPHSGTSVPPEVAALFHKEYRTYQPNTDWHLDTLLDFLPHLGVTVLRANASRYVVDVNRPLDAPLFGPYRRSAVYSSTTRGKPLYPHPPTDEDIERRVELFYRPYHDRLAALLENLRVRFGKVYLLDLHSFMGLIGNDVCLGDGDGSVAARTLMPLLKMRFEQHGFDVVTNKVFTGGHTVRRYGKLPDIEALQVELRYTTYLKREQLDRPYAPAADVPELVRARARYRAVFEEVVQYLAPH